MLAHYGHGHGHRTWRTLTPAALPETAARRRIDPALAPETLKAGSERSGEEARAHAAVIQALRHTKLAARVVGVSVQREPFEPRGERAEPFADGTRFAKERLWHVALELDRPVTGPLVIGDGRYLGLGVMAPERRVARPEGLWVFEVTSGLVVAPDVSAISRALRRAVMARVRDALPEGTPLPRWVHGHEVEGTPSQQDHAHLAFGVDARRRLLWVIAPHVLGKRTVMADEGSMITLLGQALRDLRQVRAGTEGLLELRHHDLAPNDPLVGSAWRWESLSDYVVTRHAKQTRPDDILRLDVHRECRRLGLPEPEVVVRSWRAVPGVGLTGRLMLRFARRVRGPLALGRTAHLGGGVFVASAR